MDGPKLLMLAVAVLVCVIFISTIIALKGTGDENNANANAQLEGSLSEADLSDLNKYVGKQIYGSEVKFIIERYLAKYQIQTFKAEDEGLSVFEGTSIADFPNIGIAGDPMYVDQSMLFQVSGIYGQNDQMFGLRFEEVRK